LMALWSVASTPVLTIASAPDSVVGARASVASQPSLTESNADVLGGGAAGNGATE
jgi:hypothetical protein